MRPESLLFVMTLVAACGGRSEDRQGGDGDGDGDAMSSGGGGGSVMGAGGTGGALASDGGTPGDGGGIMSDGGSPGDGDGDDIVFGGGSVGTGGTGASGGAGACSEHSFWLLAADELIGGLGPCGPDVCGEGETPMGSITFGEEGEILAFSQNDEDIRAAFLEEVDDQEWPCLAGQSSDYCCHPR